MNLTDFSLHFTIKEQSLESIKELLANNDEFQAFLSMAKKGNGATLHHCFLPREVVIQKNFSTDLVDFLDSICEKQVRWYGTGKDLNESRRHMIENLSKIEGVAVFVGEIKEGVAEEMDIAIESECAIMCDTNTDSDE